jgi:putative membrane protein
MARHLYEHIPVTDGLAAERTVLAAERTALAYVRTALTLLVAGLTGARLANDRWLVGVGYVLTGTSLIVFAVGIIRFRSSRRTTRAMIERLQRERAATPGSSIRAAP